MSRWSQIVENPELAKELTDFYQQAFPIEVRYFLCQWFEEQQWHLLDPDNPSHEPEAAELLKAMLAQLRAKMQELHGDDFLIIRMRLDQTGRDFQNSYQNNALGFLRIIKQCLDKEAELFQVLQTANSNDTMGQTETVLSEQDEARQQRESTNQRIMAQLHEFQVKTQNTEKKYKEMQDTQESFIIQFQTNEQLKAQIQVLQTQMNELRISQGNGRVSTQILERQLTEKTIQAEQKGVDSKLSELGKRILEFRIELANIYHETILELQTIQKVILDDELIGWKRRQQLGGNGCPPDKSDLDMLQQWCEHLAEVIWSIRQQIKKMGQLRAQLPIGMPPNIPDRLPDLNDIITGMLSSLVTSTFIVEQQPPQVMKKESRFSAIVRLLVGGKLNVQMNPPLVKASIISEQQAKCLLRSDMKAKSLDSGDILNNTGTMDFQTSAGSYISGCLSVQFRNMQLKKIRRSDKKGSEAVTEEKFCILFQSDFNVGGNDLVFQVWTLSLPVVVTVHGNQECNALATILWDNAFSEPGRVPFVVPDQVPWHMLGEQLDVKFKQLTGRGLSHDNLDYLASKIFGGTVQSDYSQRMVSWVQFNKDTLKDRPFTFWEWFHTVLKLTKEHLKGPWTDGSIIGFISKQKAQECLNQQSNGTFLLRFSESECGGITIAWIAESQTNANDREVWNLAPYITRDFAIRSLADRIKDLNNLVALYPDVPKDSAFGEYYSMPQEPEPQKDGYIKTHLVNVMVPPVGVPMGDDPRTPQNFPPPSPATSIPPGSSLPDIENMDELMECLTSTTDYDPNDFTNIDTTFINVAQSFTNFQPSP